MFTPQAHTSSQGSGLSCQGLGHMPLAQGGRLAQLHLDKPRTESEAGHPGLGAAGRQALRTAHTERPPVRICRPRTHRPRGGLASSHSPQPRAACRPSPSRTSLGGPGEVGTAKPSVVGAPGPIREWAHVTLPFQAPSIFLRAGSTPQTPSSPRRVASGLCKCFHRGKRNPSQGLRFLEAQPRLRVKSAR